MQEDCLAPAPNVHGTTYKCSMGCDYDICQKCWDNPSGSTLAMTSCLSFSGDGKYVAVR